MFDRILKATSKQFAIAFFLFWLAVGFLFGASTFLDCSRDEMPTANALTLASIAFCVPASFGVFTGGIFLIIHHLTKRYSEDGGLTWRWTSETVKDIVRHLSEEEKRNHRRQGAIIGGLFGIVGAILSFSIDLLLKELTVFSVARMVVVAFLYFASLFFLLKRSKRFLAATEYAQKNNIKPEDIQFVSWARSQPNG